MKQETKRCKNCRQEFTIDPEDFNFYEKMQVPPPTWCPECRLSRRLMFRNERTLYKDMCALTGKSIISMYAPGHPFPVYSVESWWSDEWDPMDYGRDYNFSKPFFEQFRELRAEVPRMNLAQTKAVSAEYANYIEETRNVYLGYSVVYGSENVYFSKNVDAASDIFDGFDVMESERCYEANNSYRNYNCAFVLFSENCIDSHFLYDCVNCESCFGCVNLRNKSYHIFNKPYTKEEYKNEIGKLDTASYARLEKVRKKFFEFALKFPRKSAHIVNCKDCTGDDLANCKRVSWAFSSYRCEDAKYIFRCPDMKDAMDITNSGRSELVYEFISGGAQNSQRIRFTATGLPSLTDTHYTEYCHSSSNLFGCIGLRSKQYCILNKQYSKEEYEALVPSIIEHMSAMPYVDARGREYRYGEFFPSELSPFAYNETIAQEYFPLTREQAEELRYRWREPEAKQHEVTVQPVDLPDHIKDVDDSILGETLGCEHQGKCNEQCTTAFKLIPQELQFYRRMSLPLPRLCPNCRHYRRLVQRNPLKLWHRQCQCGGARSEKSVYQNVAVHQHHGQERCLNEFETSYAPERKEIVYCEKCYNEEVI